MIHDEREWQAQERAFADERRATAAAATDDPLAARYRPLMRALREPPADGLPADFARRVAERAIRTSTAARGEYWLDLALLAALLVSGAVTATIYGGDWFATLARLPHASNPAIGWILALVLCGGLSWLDRLREHRAGHA
jgi:hypothetical protein